MIRFTTPHFLGLFALLCSCWLSCGDSSSSPPEQTQAKGENVYARGEMEIQHGMELFNLHCASCHNFTENGIGPNLMGVTAEVDKEWLVSFIQNPPAMIEGGDERAVELFEKYKQYMPPFAMLAEEDLEDILGFVHKFSQGEKRNKNNRPGGLLNPIPEKITTSNMTLILEEQFIVPASSEVPPLTRINQMEPIANGRLFLHDIRGKLYEITNEKELSVYMDAAELLPEFIDNPGKGSGLGSWAFHPDFEQNGLFYTTHTEPKGTAQADFALPDSVKITLQSVLLEWKADDPQSESFTGSYRELLRADMVGGAHTFQELNFNPLASPGDPDYGMLYLGIGDGQTALAGYPDLCESKESIWCKVIRIDPLGDNSANGQYGIPGDNPWLGEAGAAGEVWAAGFRNPHRITWDETGSEKMLISNIGQHSVEELNLGQAGAHYGWPQREGTFLFDVDANVELVYPLPKDDEGYTYPVVQYDHDEGSAISGGYVYNGKISALRGKYVFGDISRGMLFYTEVAELEQGKQAPMYRLSVAINGQVSDMETICGHKRVDLRIGLDQEGELYLMTKGNGGVYKIVDVRLETL